MQMMEIRLCSLLMCNDCVANFTNLLYILNAGATRMFVLQLLWTMQIRAHL